jgi:hypothetical protein
MAMILCIRRSEVDQLKLKYKKFDSLRRFGVEIEVGSEVKKKVVQTAIMASSKYDAHVSRYSLSTNNRYWHIKDDATCGIKGRKGPKGVEIASFVGHGINDINHISFIASKLSEIGCRVNENCGLHVHAEVSDLSVEQVSIFMAHWIKLEKIFSLILPMRRNKSEYCKFIFPIDVEKNENNICRDKFYSPDNLWSMLSPKNLSYYDNDDRRYNLNLVNLVRAIKYNHNNRKTIELRWPEGTLDPRDIRCWVKLFLIFIENCKNKKMPTNLKSCNLKEALDYFGLLNTNNNFSIMSASIQETKTWFLERIIDYNPDAIIFHKDEKLVKIADEARLILNEMWRPIRVYS